jgi:hypothetical protein
MKTNTVKENKVSNLVVSARILGLSLIISSLFVALGLFWAGFFGLISYAFGISS